MSFSKSSKDVSINGSILTASCRNKKGDYHITTIDLDEYIGNKQGKLIWGGKNFSRSSKDIVLRLDNILECKSRDSNGKYLGTILDLDEHISNSDGFLKYK